MGMGAFAHSLAKHGQNIDIQRRELVGSNFDSDKPVEQFTTVFTEDAIIKTLGTDLLRGNKFFNGVSIVKDATHVFCITYDVTKEGLEQNNYFVLLNGKRYKILQITNLNECNKALLIQCVVRGDSSKEATKA